MNTPSTTTPAPEAPAPETGLAYAQLMQKQDEIDERIAELERLASDLAGQIKEMR
ncbi:MAG TPA: hypothetical protein VHC95_02710 [Opitutales bacterium]|nr:hypothetical protein [Opitutales bacterium]